MLEYKKGNNKEKENTKRKTKNKLESYHIKQKKTKGRLRKCTNIRKSETKKTKE